MFFNKNIIDEINSVPEEKVENETQAPTQNQTPTPAPVQPKSAPALKMVSDNTVPESPEKQAEEIKELKRLIFEKEQVLQKYKKEMKVYYDLRDTDKPMNSIKKQVEGNIKKKKKKRARLLNIIRNLPEGISEIHIHPSIESEEIKKINPTWEERVLEYKLMMDDDISDEMEKYNVKLITYKDIKNNKSKFKSIYEIFYYGSRYVSKKILR